MSFNLGTHSSRHDANDSRWIENIAEIITVSNADLILLQEVPITNESDTKDEFLRRVKDVLLGSQYHKHWQSLSTVSYIHDTTGSVPAKKLRKLNNAMLYDGNKLSCILGGYYPINFKDIYTSQNYQPRFNNIQVVQFAFPQNQNKNLLVMNIHAYFKEPHSDLKFLCNIIRDYTDKQEFIIGGDINLSLEPAYDAINTGVNRKIYIDGIDMFGGVRQGLKTTLSTKKEEDKITLAHDYDHFIYSSGIKTKEEIHHVFSKVKLDSYDAGTIKVKGKAYKSAQEFKQDVSDHLPVVMTFYLP